MPFNPWDELEREGAYPPSPGREEAIRRAAEVIAARKAKAKADYDAKHKRKGGRTGGTK